MKEKAKNILIKLILTIPALIIGILSAVAFILKPLKDLWLPKSDFEQQVDEIIDSTK